MKEWLRRLFKREPALSPLDLYEVAERVLLEMYSHSEVYFRMPVQDKVVVVEELKTGIWQGSVVVLDGRAFKVKQLHGVEL